MSGTRVPSAPTSSPQYDPRWMYWFWDWVQSQRVAAGTYGGTGVSLKIVVNKQGWVTSITTAT